MGESEGRARHVFFGRCCPQVSCRHLAPISRSDMVILSCDVLEMPSCAGLLAPENAPNCTGTYACDDWKRLRKSIDTKENSFT